MSDKHADKMKYPPFTLGWELEACNRARGYFPDLEVAHDGSVHGDSMEYKIRREAVFDPPRSLHALRQLVSDPALRTDTSCGFHVHVGLGKKTRRGGRWAASFVSLARLVEHAAFQAVPESRRSNHFCRSWKNEQAPPSIIQKSYQGSKYNNPDRYYWINFVEMFRPNGIRTVEVRLMGDTKRYPLLLAWMSMCRLMAMSAWRIMYDPSILVPESEAIIRRLELVRKDVLLGISPETSRRALDRALLLAQEAQLLPDRKKPLGPLISIEMAQAHSGRYAAYMERMYNEMLARIRADVEVVQQARAAFRAGSYVTALRDMEEITQGHTYLVSEVMDDLLVLAQTNDRYDFNVRANGFRLATTDEIAAYRPRPMPWLPGELIACRSINRRDGGVTPGYIYEVAIVYVNSTCLRGADRGLHDWWVPNECMGRATEEELEVYHRQRTRSAERELTREDVSLREAHLDYERLAMAQ